LQTLNYAYNIRSWLTNINDVLALGEDMFALGLGYTGGDNPQYNGNIAAMQWATEDFGTNTYNFDYDGANRITVADFSGTGQHNTSYSYDKNGNIMSLTREGRHGGSNLYGDIDNLTYTYQGNQLQSVNDISYGAYQADGFKDNGSFEPIEYTYDDNGNMLTDSNKSLSISKYNHLNLPEQLNLNPPQHYYEISYLYSATGQKLHKATHIDFTPATTTDYVGSFIYQDGQLQSILTHEGRVVVDGSSYEYQYFLKDHLGNTRITFNESGIIIQEDSYYPYGMNMAGLSESSGIDLPNKYLYNGKELQDDFGLGWYDYGYRLYDAHICRWNGMDPYADIYENLSPYNYALNSPINIIDPDGRLVIYVNGFRQNAYKKWLFSLDPLVVPPPHESNPSNWYYYDHFDYWSDTRENWSFEVNGEESYFVDGSNHALSSAKTRFSKGEIEGAILAEKLKTGEITLQDGEFIKLVAHSMGAAHAIGLAKGLFDAGIDPRIVKVFLFASHQPNQIPGIDGVDIFQFGRDGDKVSSEGFLAFVSGSKHERIPGSDWVLAPDRVDEEYGGHYVQTFTASEFKEAAPRLYQYLIDAGYINPDGTLK
ncbi:MAG: RHS repeat-associated core domain-containing protein, partial [Bacteroidales bacterium]|nr:RHS repeat-associated core domain-containing protein [Bacteroidales bacterium]